MLRLIDLLAIAVDDMRQGGDPRLPLELALVKITRPQADLSRDSLAHRLEVLEARPHGGRSRRPRAEPRRRSLVRRARPASATRSRRRRAAGSRPPTPAARRAPRLPPLELDQLRDAWQRDVVDAVQEPVDPDLDARRRGAAGRDRGDTVTIEFAPAGRVPPDADRGSEEPRDARARRSTRSRAGGSRSRPSSARRRAGRARRSARALRGGRDLAAQGHIRRRGSGGAVMAKFDMNAMLKQAQQMQAQMMEAQEQAQAGGRRGVRRRRDGHREGERRRRDRRDHDRPEGDRPRRPGDARRHRDGGGERGAALGEPISSSRRSVGQMPDLGALGLPGL